MENDPKEVAKDEENPLVILPLMGNVSSDPVRGGFAIPFGLNGELIKDNPEEEDELRK